jgi:Flp pilus assembly protein TadG
MLNEPKGWRRMPLVAMRLARDPTGIAATEFAVIAPVMLVLFLGVVEMSNGIAAYRKISITAHTISDLTSQAASVTDTDLGNFFCASSAIMAPYVTPTNPCPPSPSDVKQSIVELWVNSSLQARVQWGKNSDGTAAVAAGTVVPIPAQLQVANTYIIYATATYTYVPVVGYVMNTAGVILSDSAYTRPRQSLCVQYNAPSSSPCPQN